VPALFGAGPDDQVYITRRTNDGQTDVIFGDGTQGARLPSGVSNVVATYRTGVGLDGQVDARTLSLLTARPLGVKGAINPLAAAGAAEPAELDDAKQNAPLTVRTIDRVVSVSDVEDFARSFAGIGKAQARLLWNGSAQVVQLTIGGADGQPIAPDAELTINLAKSLRANGDPSLLLRQPLDSFEEHRFTLAVQLDIDQRFEKPDVREAVRTALLDAFSFGRRDFGQSVGEAEILAVVQGIPGVIAANVAHLEDERTSAAGKLLTVGVARFDKDNAFHQAGLLIVNPAHLDLSQDLTP
jgi:predicted phage baseplate assembly protein